MMKSSSKNTHKKGVTLIELLVVLAVLAAIAGITVPLVSDANDEAHIGNSVTNINNINTSVATQKAKTGKYPDNLDSLMSGAAGSEVLTDILAGTITDLSVITLTTEQAESLEHAGITTLHAFDTKANLDAASKSYTFDPYSGTAYDIETDLKAVQISSAVVNAQLGAPLADTYVVFGYGAKNSNLGSFMLECPVHYAHGGEVAEGYNRFLCVFKLGSGHESPATYVGSIANDEGSFIGVNGHLEEHFN